jgi:DnaJ family protein B protein 4
MLGSAFGGIYYDYHDPPVDLEVIINCRLEDLYKGGIKRLFFNRIVINNDSRTTEVKECFKDIEIVKGSKNGTIKTYPGEGNQKPGYKSSNLIVKIVEIPHDQFRRNGDDLSTILNVTLVEAIKGKVIEITTLDDRKITLLVDEIIR